MLSVLLGLGSVITGIALYIFTHFGEDAPHVLESSDHVFLVIFKCVWLAFTISFLVSVFT